VETSAVGSEQVQAKTVGQLVAAPSGLTAGAVSQTRIDLTWSDNSNNESGFELYRSTSGETGTFELRATPSGNTTGFSDAFAQAGTRYCFKIRAVRTTGLKSTYSGFSTTACATTLEPPAPPPPPPPSAATGLYALAQTSTSVAITWGSTGVVSGFRIERSQDGGGTWSSIATISEAASSRFQDEGLASDQQVCYRVIAYNLHGEAPPSNTACTAPPAAPTNLVGTRRDDGAIYLTWSDNSTVEDGYEVWVQIIQYNSDCDAGCFTDVYNQVVGIVAADSTSFLCSDCAGLPTFIMATKGGGWSDMSNTILVP
jgi:titin